MGRKEAREIALHLIFELSFKQFDDAELVSARLEQEVMESLAGDVALYAGELPEGAEDLYSQHRSRRLCTQRRA